MSNQTTFLEIGDEITYTTSAGEFTGVVEGRDWWGKRVSAYTVMHGYEEIPICATSFKCQFGWV